MMLISIIQRSLLLLLFSCSCSSVLITPSDEESSDPGSSSTWQNNEEMVSMKEISNRDSDLNQLLQRIRGIKNQSLSKVRQKIEQEVIRFQMQKLEEKFRRNIVVEIKVGAGLEAHRWELLKQLLDIREVEDMFLRREYTIKQILNPDSDILDSVKHGDPIAFNELSGLLEEVDKHWKHVSITYATLKEELKKQKSQIDDLHNKATVDLVDTGDAGLNALFVELYDGLSLTAKQENRVKLYYLLARKYHTMERRSKQILGQWREIYVTRVRAENQPLSGTYDSLVKERTAFVKTWSNFEKARLKLLKKLLNDKQVSLANNLVKEEWNSKDMTVLPTIESKWKTSYKNEIKQYKDTFKLLKSAKVLKS